MSRRPRDIVNNLRPNQQFAMSTKKSFVLRLDETAYAALEKWAADDFRSVNGQLEWIISQALKEAGRTPKSRHQDNTPTSEEGSKTD